MQYTACTEDATSDVHDGAAQQALRIPPGAPGGKRTILKEFTMDDTTTITFAQVRTDTLEKIEQMTSLLAVKVWAHLVRIRDFATDTRMISQGKLADRLGASRQGIQNALAVLRDAGLLSWETVHRKAATYAIHGLHKRSKPSAASPSGVGANTPSGVGSIQESLSSKKNPLPPTADGPSPAEPSPAGEGIFEEEQPPATDATRPAAEGGAWHPEESRRSARDSVPSGMAFEAIDRLVASQCDSPLPGQSVPRRHVRAEYEGPSHQGIRPDAVGTAVTAVIGASTSATTAPRAFTRAVKSVAAMGRYGEITPHMLDAAAERSTDSRGTNLAAFATDVWRQVMTHRWCHGNIAARLEFQYGDHRPTPTGIATRSTIWRDLLIDGGRVSA